MLFFILALSNNSTTFYLEDISFENFSSPDHGGAVFIKDFTKIICFKNLLFHQCQSLVHGGGYYIFCQFFDEYRIRSTECKAVHRGQAGSISILNQSHSLTLSKITLDKKWICSWN
ncbi:MAG: hypothetical protein Ta2E_12840 [Mycoplasmoidaceae bacterium]|nr:MAG: hypothetical protein Ta2E_12840 [Mycoplasmoidaceae bacterium]